MNAGHVSDVLRTKISFRLLARTLAAGLIKLHKLRQVLEEMFTVCMTITYFINPHVTISALPILLLIQALLSYRFCISVITQQSFTDKSSSALIKNGHGYLD